ncbi:hypothetical protein [Streptomyces albofaciens]|nr:hypothetical protein [Streptomyces albofaciens]
MPDIIDGVVDATGTILSAFGFQASHQNDSMVVNPAPARRRP